MKTNRVQFQPGLSRAEFMDRYRSEEQRCEREQRGRQACANGLEVRELL